MAEAKAPEVVKIAITAADDSVMIMSFITNDWHGLVQDPTPENIQACIDKMSTPQAPGDLPAFPLEKLPVKSWRVIEDHSEIPADRTYRNALKDNGRLYHCMDRARELHRDILREARAPLMAALDVEYMRADEHGDADKKKEISAKKKALRDITKHPAIDAAKTTEDLKKITVPG